MNNLHSEVHPRVQSERLTHRGFLCRRQADADSERYLYALTEYEITLTRCGAVS
jgi:hypothetical protein